MTMIEWMRWLWWTPIVTVRLAVTVCELFRHLP
jgi:hypothetical protein